MYVVIFRAQVGSFDSDYFSIAAKLRDKAISHYGCQEFISFSDKNQEIALSYWSSLEDIQRWKTDELHLRAQSLGQTQWYKGYRVEVAEIHRSYGNLGVSQG